MVYRFTGAQMSGTDFAYTTSERLRDSGSRFFGTRRILSAQQREVAMFGPALGALSDLGGGGLAALMAVILFLLFTFWVGSLGPSTRS